MVFSHERLSGYPASGGYDSSKLIRSMQEIFPAGRILIVIREQVSLIQSMYSQIITDGGSCSLKGFLNPPEPKFVRVPQFNLKFYEFDRIIKYCQNLFGVENTLVLPYELIQENYQNFLDEIGFFTHSSNWLTIKRTQEMPSNVPMNTKKTVLLQSFNRVLNGCFYRNQLSNSAMFEFQVIPKLIRRIDPLTRALTPKFL
ncbi:MAG: hypothetical protein HC908_10200, partial [Calothrix sp. SM1_7_51]|nr:hypothetical protein [Calothrix sp. SM1_7_51]